MTKTLTKHGNSFALVIERPIMELLGIDAKTPLSITTDGRCRVIAPAGSAKRQGRFRKALAEGNRRYGKAMRNLAK